MKKIIAMLLACVMVLGLAACGGTPAANQAPAANNGSAATEVTEITLKGLGSPGRSA